MNSRNERAAAREERRNLQVPPIVVNHGLGRGDLIRSRSPSPAAPASAPEHFNFPPAPVAGQFNNAMATEEQLQALRDQIRNEVRAEIRNETAVAAAGIPDAIRRKPEIPPFDKTHVEIWIKRTENAFIRANITAVNEKFAFLETKFNVGFDPRIDEFLYGDATPAAWTSFLAYLRKEFGPTKQQRAAIFLDGFKREGRKPSQYAAALIDKTKDVEIDDIMKEMLLREMPTDVRRMLQERIETTSFRDAAKIADSYFDSEGRPRHTQSSSGSVNEVADAFENVAIADDEDVNAVGRRFPQRNGHQNRFRNQQRRKFETPAAASAPNPRSGTPSSAPDRGKPPSGRRENKGAPTVQKLCKYHIQFGDGARTCERGCDKFASVSSNGKAGRQA